MSERILITGAAGFIGSHLCRSLRTSGHAVVGVDNFDPFYGRDRKQANLVAIEHVTGGAFRFLEMDVRDRDRLRSVMHGLKPTAIVHLAGLAGVRPSVLDPERYAAVNVEGLTSVLDVARATGCRNVVFASSSSVYGNNRKVPFAESDATDAPMSPYAATKRTGELLCAEHAARHGMSIAAVRFFTVYGPAQRPDLAIARFMDRLARGKAIPMFGDGSNTRDYTYIDDIVEGVHAVIRRVRAAPDGFSRVYNLGGSKAVRLDELIAMIGRVAGIEPVVERCPVPPGDVDRTWADVSRARAELGWTPRTGLMDGLRRQWRALGSVTATASELPEARRSCPSTPTPLLHTISTSPARSSSRVAAAAAG